METKTIKAIVHDPKPQVDIMGIYLHFATKYRNVFIFQADEKTYIYRALGRGEYREILEDRRFNDLVKEELVCSQCLLYPDPKKLDWNKEDAGIPYMLAKDILKNSYLDDLDKRKSLHEYYRTEMYDLDNQITCLINEAFPNIDIEEIEKWDVDKTTKYLSRAEWKLHNLRGIPFKEAEGTYREYSQNQQSGQSAQTNSQQKIQKQENKGNDNRKTIRGGSRANKLTPEKMKEREEFYMKHPEFAGLHDDGLDGFKGLEQASVDTTTPALRPGF